MIYLNCSIILDQSSITLDEVSSPKSQESTIQQLGYASKNKGNENEMFAFEIDMRNGTVQSLEKHINHHY